MENLISCACDFTNSTITQVSLSIPIIITVTTYDNNGDNFQVN